MIAMLIVRRLWCAGSADLIKGKERSRIFWTRVKRDVGLYVPVFVAVKRRRDEEGSIVFDWIARPREKIGPFFLTSLVDDGLRGIEQVIDLHGFAPGSA
jgi:hypothetical protein